MQEKRLNVKHKFKKFEIDGKLNTIHSWKQGYNVYTKQHNIISATHAKPALENPNGKMLSLLPKLCGHVSSQA